MSRVLQLAESLISKQSVTPDDAGCQAILADRLSQAGFDITPMDRGEVSNLWARYGRADPVVCLAGHTDVVPSGPRADWTTEPFEPTRKGDWLYGRGSADMKAALAAMIVATEDLLAGGASLSGSLAFLITSDEEGVAVDGTAAVVRELASRHESIDYCLIGEPSCTRRLGDTVRIGRRGSLTGELKVQGIQGHVAYPAKASNPLHELAPAILELTSRVWDSGNEQFPATTLQITDIRAGTGASNVIPGDLDMTFNLRYSTEQTAEGLQSEVAAILDKHGVTYALDWIDSGRPFVTEDGALVSATRQAIQDVCGLDPELSTGGGTSDGRFIAPTGAQVVEFGHINDSIHQVDERVRIDDLEQLKDVYVAILKRLLIA